MAMGLGSYDWTKDPYATPGRKRKKQGAAGTTAAGASIPGTSGTVPGVSTTPMNLGVGTGMQAAQTQLPNSQTGATLRSPGGTSTGRGIVSQSPLGGNLGALEPHGQMVAAQSPQAMWGQMLPGGSGSNAAGFYGSMFNPEDLGMAAGLGGGMQTNQDYLQIGQELAREFSGGAGAGKFLNPVMMMQNLVALASNQTEKAVAGGQGGVGPMAAITAMNPAEALEYFIGVAKGALTSTMPEDVANAYLAMIRRIGMQYVDQWMRQPYEQEGQQGTNVIKYIAQKLGPTMGLSSAGQGGMGTSEAQVSTAF